MQRDLPFLDAEVEQASRSGYTAEEVVHCRLKLFDTFAVETSELMRSMKTDNFIIPIDVC